MIIEGGGWGGGARNENKEVRNKKKKKKHFPPQKCLQSVDLGADPLIWRILLFFFGFFKLDADAE